MLLQLMVNLSLLVRMTHVLDRWHAPHHYLLLLVKNLLHCCQTVY
jgi:hypothetical protein